MIKKITIIGYDGRPVTMRVGESYFENNTKDNALASTHGYEGKGRIVMVQEDKR